MGKKCIWGLTLALTAMLAAAGCGPAATEAAYRNMINSYMGRHIDSMVTAWGPADRKHSFADGSQMYSFTRNRRAYVDPPALSFYGGLGWGRFGRGYYGAYLSGGRRNIREISCETRVTTDRKGLITGISYRGQNCRAYPPEAAAQSNSGRNFNGRR